jgi:hypothetical protein
LALIEAQGSETPCKSLRAFLILITMYTYYLCNDGGFNTIEFPILIFPESEFHYDEFFSNYKVEKHELNDNDELIIICEKIY